MRRFGLLGVLLVGLLSVTLLQPVSAQEEWECHFDFTLSDFDWGSEAGLYVEGVGWQTDGPFPSQSLIFGYGFAPTVITSVEMIWSWDMTPERSNGWIRYGTVDDTFDGDSPRSVTATATATAISLAIGNGSEPASPNATGILTDVTVTGLGEIPFEFGCDEEPPGADWIRPLLATDENTQSGPALVDGPSLADLVSGGPFPGTLDDFFAPGNEYRVTARSLEPGAPVLAAQSGTVVDIKIFAGDMCSLWGAVITMGAECWFGSPNDPLNFIDLYSFPIDDTIQQVAIEMGDGNQLLYLVANANRYVELHQEVQAGCAVGETIEARELQINDYADIIATIVGNFVNLGGLVIPGQNPGFGVTFAEERNPGEFYELVELLPKLTTYNETATPCNTAPEFQDCLVADSDLTNFPDAWEKLGDVQDTEAGLLLSPNSYIQQTVNLPSSTDFYFRVGLYFNLLDLVSNPASTTREVTFRVGSFEATQIVPVDDSYQEFSIEVPEPEPDLGGLYTVRIENTGELDTGGVIIAAACLSATDHELNPRACYFQNPEFDSTQGWVTTNVQQGNGFIILGDADAVLQEVTLEANEDDSPRTYRLEVDARPIAAPGQVLDTNSGSATLYYSWEGVETIGTLDLQWNLPGNPGYPDAYQTFSVDIEVAEQSTDDFIIYTGFVDNATVNIALSRACLSTDTDTPEGGGVGGPFHTTCNTIPVPTDDSFGVWTMYHWRNLDKFFNCKLMVLLNKWFKLFDEFRRTMLLVARWWIAMANKLANWASSLLYWLNGHFRNIAVGQITTIDQGGGGPGIWDVLLALINGVFSPLIQMVGQIVGLLLAIISQAASLLLTILTAAISFIILLVGQFLSLFALAKGLLTALLAAYASSTPIPIPMLPTCHIDPTSGLCPGFWILDNTILSGPGVVIVPIMIGLGSIHLILWVITSIRRNALEVGNAT